MAMLLVSWDDLQGVLGVGVFMALVVGLAALMLWLRDRSRDRRGVPEWARRISELKARRMVAACHVLAHAIAAVAGLALALRASSRSSSVFALIVVGVVLWTARNYFNRYRVLTLEIRSIEQENRRPENKLPYEPLG